MKTFQEKAKTIKDFISLLKLQPSDQDALLKGVETLIMHYEREDAQKQEVYNMIEEQILNDYLRYSGLSYEKCLEKVSENPIIKKMKS